MVNDKMVNSMKRIYFQPEIEVVSIALQSTILAGSAEETIVISNTETSSVW